MKRTHIVLGIYLLIGLIYTIYASNWGDKSYKSFAYHLGQGLVWPAMIFPGIGKWIGGLLIVAMVAFVMGS